MPNALPNPGLNPAPTPSQPFSFQDAAPAAKAAAVAGGDVVPAGIAPYMPTAPWSTVSGPGGKGAALGWSTVRRGGKVGVGGLGSGVRLGPP